MSFVYDSTSLREPVDITDPLHAICALLHLEPKNVARLTIEGTRAEAIVYGLNESGKKYITATDGIAAEVRRIRVKT